MPIFLQEFDMNNISGVRDGSSIIGDSGELPDLENQKPTNRARSFAKKEFVQCCNPDVRISFNTAIVIGVGSLAIVGIFRLFLEIAELGGVFID